MAFTQANEYIAHNDLVMLERALDKYPGNFFDIFKKDGGYNLTIILVSQFTNDNLALATKNKNREFKIYLSNYDNFERAFHHEMYHVMEFYISSINNKSLFGEWINYNPGGFIYIPEVSKLDETYVYKYSDLKSSYFVSKYSKTSEKEDRAEIFAELMTLNEKPNYLYPGQNINKKVNYLIDTLKANTPFVLESSSFYWFKFL